MSRWRDHKLEIAERAKYHVGRWHCSLLVIQSRSSTPDSNMSFLSQACRMESLRTICGSLALCRQVVIARQYSNADAPHMDVGIPSVSPSVCLSVCHETPWYIIILLSACGRPIILVFSVLNIFAKCQRGHPYHTGALNTGRVYKFHDFRPIFGYVSETIQDRDIVTMERFFFFFSYSFLLLLCYH